MLSFLISALQKFVHISYRIHVSLMESYPPGPSTAGYKIFIDFQQPPFILNLPILTSSLSLLRGGETFFI